LQGGVGEEEISKPFFHIAISLRKERPRQRSISTNEKKSNGKKKTVFFKGKEGQKKTEIYKEGFKKCNLHPIGDWSAES